MEGSDDPSNLIELTIEEHAEAHRLLYEEYGHWQDKIAWQGLSKMIGKEDLIKTMQSLAMKQYRSRPEVIEKYAKANKRRWDNADNHKQMSESAKRQWEDPEFAKMHSDKMLEHNKKVWSDPEISSRMIASNRKNNRRIKSLNDGHVTTWSNKGKHEKKTGYIHKWEDIV